MYQLQPLRPVLRSILILVLGPLAIVQSANCTSSVKRLDCEENLPSRYHRYEFAISNCAQGAKALKPIKEIGRYSARPARASAVVCPGYETLALEPLPGEEGARRKFIFVSLLKTGSSCSLSVVVEQEPICHHQSFSAPPHDPARANSDHLATKLVEQLLRDWKMVGTVPGTFENIGDGAQLKKWCTKEKARD